MDFTSKCLNDGQYDILCLQETWLMDTQLHHLGNIHPDYQYMGTSGMDSSSEILSGRPYGGTAILWKKSLGNVTIESTKHRRLSCVSLNISGLFTILVACIYMPCDSMRINYCNDEFIDVLDVLEQQMHSKNFDSFLLCGDWNTSLERGTAQTHCFKQFIERNGIHIGWNHEKAIHSDTYINLALNQFSCIDHFLMSSNLFSSIIKHCILENYLNTSNHAPLILELSLSYNRAESPYLVNENKKVCWEKVTPDNLADYKRCLDNLLRNTQIYFDCMQCNDVTCTNSSHLLSIENMCNDLVNCCLQASQMTLPVSSNKHKKQTIPLWNQVAKPVRQNSMFWHKIWVECNRPSKGIVYVIMKETRMKYHKTVKNILENRKDLRKELFAQALTQNDKRKFWTEVKKMEKSSKVLPAVVDGKDSFLDICNVFKNKYKDLYQSNSTTDEEMYLLNEQINEMIANEESQSICNVMVDDVRKAFCKLNKDKNDGRKGANSNHFIHAPLRLVTMFAILFKSMLVHGFSPEEMKTSVIISIPKNPRGNLYSSDNYRGIALGSALCKVIDYWILSKYGSMLHTSDLQFGKL